MVKTVTSKGDTMHIYERAKDLKNEIGCLNDERSYSVAKELLNDINDASVSKDERNISDETMAMPARAVMGAELLCHSDPVNPDHYRNLAVEPISAIEAWHLGFHLGNAVKYIARAGRKSPDVLTDLKKARWYLDREIANRENIMKGQ
jgi:hypothetical protein